MTEDHQIVCPTCQGFGWDPAIEGNSICPLCEGEGDICKYCNQSTLVCGEFFPETGLIPDCDEYLEYKESDVIEKGKQKIKPDLARWVIEKQLEKAVKEKGPLGDDVLYKQMVDEQPAERDVLQSAIDGLRDLHHVDLAQQPILNRVDRDRLRIVLSAAERLKEVEQERDRLRERWDLLMAGPWDCRSVLVRLADAADHLLDVHSCDAHGWEGVTYARDAARRLVAEVFTRPGLPTTHEKPADTPGVNWKEVRQRLRPMLRAQAGTVELFTDAQAQAIEDAIAHGLAALHRQTQGGSATHEEPADPLRALRDPMPEIRHTLDERYLDSEQNDDTEVSMQKVWDYVVELEDNAAWNKNSIADHLRVVLRLARRAKSGPKIKPPSVLEEEYEKHVEEWFLEWLPRLSQSLEDGAEGSIAILIANAIDARVRLEKEGNNNDSD